MVAELNRMIQNEPVFRYQTIRKRPSSNALIYQRCSANHNVFWWWWNFRTLIRLGFKKSKAKIDYSHPITVGIHSQKITYNDLNVWHKTKVLFLQANLDIQHAKPMNQYHLLLHLYHNNRVALKIGI